ncbi:Protein kinase domain [Dillenia turbinata]|uniref:non-specific serine/threonine protein kinase n=1 Tax=Dillenia turbinata TaxID=194707 RepID=A0AAN8W715_9MAGN
MSIAYKNMLSKVMLTLFLVSNLESSVEFNFTYNDFSSANLSLDGLANIARNGLLELTNNTKLSIGHAFHPTRINFKNSSNGTALSFSTSFVFAILSDVPALKGHGMAFVIAPDLGLREGSAGEYLGVFNPQNDGKSTNHIFAIEIDTYYAAAYNDINDNHIGIDINSISSEVTSLAGYYDDNNNGAFRNLSLSSGKAMQIWLEYDGSNKKIHVTLAPIKVAKPKIPLSSLACDLSPILDEFMYVGFSAATGSFLASHHYVLGWSFSISGQAQELKISQLPRLPHIGPKKNSRDLTIVLPVIFVVMFVLVFTSLAFLIRRKRQFAEVVEDWEREYGPQRFNYKDLYVATKGFKDTEVLGSGGFGRVYRGTLPNSKIEIAVKRVSHESRQGMKEFVAEIVSMGRLRHRNVVSLLGYCRRKRELLLVYDYMPNGSLDSYIHGQPKVRLDWKQRFQVIKGVALGLFYLHEGWEQVVIHRDIKASNVLLDAEFNGKLGDFGLARLYDHGNDPQTTHVVGTLGYLAPEQYRTAKSTPSSDVFSFGVFLLEVACGRRPIIVNADNEENTLVEWVLACWQNRQILKTADPNLGSSKHVAEDVELVLKLGLLCSHIEPTARPSMRQVVQILERDVPLPDMSSLRLSFNTLMFEQGFEDIPMPYPSSSNSGGKLTQSSAVSDILLSGGR